MIFIYYTNSNRVVYTSRKQELFLQPFINNSQLDCGTVPILDYKLAVTDLVYEADQVAVSSEMISVPDLLLHSKIKLLKSLLGRVNRHRRSIAKTVHRQDLVYTYKLTEAREYLEATNRDQITHRLQFLSDEAEVTGTSHLQAANSIIKAHNRDHELLVASEKVRRRLTLKIMELKSIDDVDEVTEQISANNLFS